jgi:hypothetical protein
LPNTVLCSRYYVAGIFTSPRNPPPAMSRFEHGDCTKLVDKGRFACCYAIPVDTKHGIHEHSLTDCGHMWCRCDVRPTRAEKAPRRCKWSGVTDEDRSCRPPTPDSVLNDLEEMVRGGHVIWLKQLDLTLSLQHGRVCDIFCERRGYRKACNSLVPKQLAHQLKFDRTTSTLSRLQYNGFCRPLSPATIRGCTTAFRKVRWNPSYGSILHRL